MDSYIMKKEDKNTDIQISSVFIDKYVPYADGTYVKIYLMGLYQCEKKQAVNRKDIAKKLNILESDVVNGWMYWQEQGVIDLSTDNKGEISIAFKDLEQRMPYPKTEVRPTYKAEEIFATASSNALLKDLLTVSEHILDKPLSSNDIVRIYSFYDYYRLPIEVITLLLTYCISIGKKNMSYIEKMALIWTEEGINDIKRAQEFIKSKEEYRSEVAKIERMIGIYDRKITGAEGEILNSWIEKNINSELIKLACDITALNTGKLSIRYINAILMEWNEKSVTNAEQARKIMEEYKKQSPTANKKSGTIEPKPNKFCNYDQRIVDYDALERKALNLKPNPKGGK